MKDLEVSPKDLVKNDAYQVVLKQLGIHPSDPAALTLVAVSHRYNLDPLLRHVILIPERDRSGRITKHTVYVTRDGLLHAAHLSGQLSGIVLEKLEKNEEQGVWEAWVAVYRKDCDHPFRYFGEYPIDPPHKHMARYAKHMAVKCAEAMALRRAFDIAAPVFEERFEAHSVEAMEMVQSMDVEPLAAEPPVTPDDEVVEDEPVVEEDHSEQLGLADEDFESPEEEEAEPEPPAEKTEGLADEEEPALDPDSARTGAIRFVNHLPPGERAKLLRQLRAEGVKLMRFEPRDVAAFERIASDFIDHLVGDDVEKARKNGLPKSPARIGLALADV